MAEASFDDFSIGPGHGCCWRDTSLEMVMVVVVVVRCSCEEFISRTAVLITALTNIPFIDWNDFTRPLGPTRLIDRAMIDPAIISPLMMVQIPRKLCNSSDACHYALAERRSCGTSSRFHLPVIPALLCRGTLTS